jgi:hypothetical protein
VTSPWNAHQRRLTLRCQLLECRLLDEYASAMRREERERHGGAGSPAVGEFRFGSMRQL